MVVQIGGAEKEFLTTSEVATLFGVAPKTIIKWARAGLLESVNTPGGHRRYRTATVEKVLNECSTQRQV